MAKTKRDIISDIKALAEDMDRSKEDRESDLIEIEEYAEEARADLPEDEDEEILCEECGEEIDNCICEDDYDEDEEEDEEDDE